MWKNGFIIIILCGCCGYSTRSVLPSSYKTISIPLVGNETVRPGIGDLLTNQLLDDFTKDRTLKIVGIDKANLSLECKITNYDKFPQSYTADQNVSTYKITLGAEVKLNDQVKSEEMWKNDVSIFITYDNQSETEDQGIDKSVKKLSQEILRKVLTSW